MRNRLEGNYVTVKPEVADSEPTPEEVRAALGRLKESEGFRSSPQLATFLGFTVEAVLRGNASGSRPTRSRSRRWAAASASILRPIQSCGSRRRVCGGRSSATMPAPVPTIRS
jgi:hypothetical protein